MVGKLKKVLASVWDVTDFQINELQAYARERMKYETRRGLSVLCVVFALLVLSEAGLHYLLFSDYSSSYTCILLSALAAHIAATSRSVSDIKSLHLLGMTLLVVSGTAFILLAQQSQNFTAKLLVSISMLFMVIPLVPWGLREGFWITGLIYFTFTISTWSNWSQLSNDYLWTLQFVMVGAAVTSLVLVARNARVRKKELASCYKLEQAHSKIMLLSNKDPLTSAWNRRYFAEQFSVELPHWLITDKNNFFACLDMDNFKSLNDTYGHTYGDQVLQWVVQSLHEIVGDKGIIVRLGGDEFALFVVGHDPKQLFDTVLKKTHSIAKQIYPNRELKIGLSVGVVSGLENPNINVDSLYGVADRALYKAKDLKTETSNINFYETTWVGEKPHISEEAVLNPC